MSRSDSGVSSAPSSTSTSLSSSSSGCGGGGGPELTGLSPLALSTPLNRRDTPPEELHKSPALCSSNPWIADSAIWSDKTPVQVSLRTRIADPI